MATVEESLEALVAIATGMLKRSTTVSFNSGKQVYHVEGRTWTEGVDGPDDEFDFRWSMEEQPSESPPSSTIIRCTTRTEALYLVLPTSLLMTVKHPIWIKDESGQAEIYPIIVSGEGGEHIDALDTFAIDTSFGAISLYAADSEWHVLTQYAG